MGANRQDQDVEPVARPVLTDEGRAALARLFVSWQAKRRESIRRFAIGFRGERGRVPTPAEVVAKLPNLRGLSEKAAARYLEDLGFLNRTKEG